MKHRLALLATAVLLAAAPAAHADTWRHDDATGDGLVTDLYADNTYSDPVPVRSERLADITRLTVASTRARLQVAISIRSMATNDMAASVQVVTSRGDRYTVGYLNNDNTNPPFEYGVRRNGYTYTCDGISLVRTRGGLLLRIPQTCLDSPYRVRVGAQTRAYGYETEEYYERKVQDDAYRTGRFTDRRPKLGPWGVTG